MTNMDSETPREQEELLDGALSALREAYEQSADHLSLEAQPEPKVGRELKTRRFPRLVSILMGGIAVGMLVVAVFLFTIQSRSEVRTVDVAAETAVSAPADSILPAPPLPVEPPLPDETILPPLEPTPWPTPPISLDSPGPD